MTKNSSPFAAFDPAAAEKKIRRFIQTEVKKSGANGVILGLSGGIDSALVAALAAGALGPKRVHAVFFYTAENEETEKKVFESDDFKEAQALALSLQISFQKTNISDLFRSAQNNLPFAGSTESSARSSAILSGNLKSRLRMSLLYAGANRQNLLVIGTKNKTEATTGYFTKYGDGGVDIDPIAGLYKTEVRLLSKYMSLPVSVLNKTPSAGFWEGQSDEEDFGMSYEQLDILLLELEKEKKQKKKGETDAGKILKKTILSFEQYESVRRRLKSAGHKQRMPKIPKI